MCYNGYVYDEWIISTMDDLLIYLLSNGISPLRDVSLGDLVIAVLHGILTMLSTYM